MRRMTLIGRLLLLPAAFLSLANGSGALTMAELERGDAAQIAARLLPPEMAEKVVNREILDPYLAKGPPAGVRFLSRAEAVGAHLCARRIYHVALHLAADGDGAPIADSLEAASAPVEQVQIAYAERCDATLRYAAVQAATLADAAALLQSLAALQATAKAGQVPSAGISCRSDISQTACAPSPVSVLARLPLDAASIVEGRGGSSWRVVITDLPPGSPVWEVALDGPADALQTVALHRSVPAPF